MSSRVFWNRTTLEAKQVFTWILSLRGSTFASSHAILAIPYHFSLSKWWFFTKHMFLYIEIEVKPTHILESFVAYWQHLDIAWPQHDPTKSVDNPKIPWDISEVNEWWKWFPSFLTYAKTKTLSHVFQHIIYL